MEGKLLTCRESFIDSFFKWLRTQNLKYAVLKPFSREIGKFSDIDLVITKDSREDILRFILNNSRSSIEKIKVFGYSYMDSICIFFSDLSFLQIDLIRDFVRKDLRYLNSSELIDTAYYDEYGIRRVRRDYGLLYLFLFYTLNKTNIPKRYVDYFAKLPMFEKKKFQELLSNKFGIKISDLDQIFFFNPTTSSKYQIHIFFLIS